MKRINQVDKKFDQKIDTTEVHALLDLKLDRSVYYEVFPRGKSPQEMISKMVKLSTEDFNERILNMIKLWDQKISNLRSELNIQGLYRKLQKFPLKEEVAEQIKQLHEEDEKTMQSILQLKIMIGKVGQMSDGTQSQIDHIFER